MALQRTHAHVYNRQNGYYRWCGSRHWRFWQPVGETLIIEQYSAGGRVSGEISKEPTPKGVFTALLATPSLNTGGVQKGCVLLSSSPPLLLRLDLWPGFVTSILQYEDNVMLCADVSHKIMRSDTVYDTLQEMFHNPRGNFHDVAIKTLIGEIVLTRLVQDSLSGPRNTSPN